MTRRIARTKNVVKLEGAFDLVRERTDEEDALCLVYGQPGLGKTIATCALFVRERGILLRAQPGWTQKALLRDLLNELGSDIRGTNADCLREVQRQISENQRPIFVDEADFLFYDSRSLESLRAIHDQAGTPIVLVGMSTLPNSPGIDRRIKRYPQLSSRITQWVEFLPADFEDTQELARACCEVPVADDLIEKLWTQSKGNIRLIRRGLVRIQRWGKKNRVEVATLQRWGDNDLFFQAG